MYRACVAQPELGTTVSSRVLIMGTSASSVNAQLIHEVSQLLMDQVMEMGGQTFGVMDAFANQPFTKVVSDPKAALNEVIISVRSEQADSLLITGAESVPAPSFDVTGWNFDVAANAAAQVVAVVDGTGMNSELIQAEVKTLRDRADRHHATMSGVVVAGVRGMDLPLTLDGLPLVETPITLEKWASVTKLAPTVVTPMIFQSNLLARAAADPQTIVLPEPEDDRVLRATAKLLDQKTANIVLLGDASSIEKRSGELGVDVSGARIVSPHDPELVEKYAAEFAQLRAKKGVTIEQAREKVQDTTYFATMMVQMGDADGMVSGAVHTTADTIVPAFQIIKTAPGTSLVSSAFLMLLSDHVLVMGDCAVNPNPTPAQLAEIAVSSANTARQFGIDPRVAMLSYSTGSSGAGADVEAVTEATAKVRELAPDLPVEGPIQYDAAVDPEVGSAKAPESEVAGQANVLIYPTLNAGNIGYKAVQRSAKAVAVGPILQGLRRPVNDLSRGATVEDIVNTVAITAVQAQAEGQN